MRSSFLSQLYRVATGGEEPLLRLFVSEAFAELLRSCPGLAAQLFGELGPIGADTPEVQTAVPTASDIPLDIVIQGESDFKLLIENRLAPDLDWFEERSEVRPTSHADTYIAAARHQPGARARVLVLSRSEVDSRRKNYPSDIFAGTWTWAELYGRLEQFLDGAGDISTHLIRQFLDLLREHDMNPSEPLTPTDADTILAFDQLARNYLKLLDESVGRIRQEFDLKATPNNRRLTGWYACSDRFQSDELHFFFYLMFPPAPDLVVRPAVQVTKESSPKGLSAAAEHGFRRGRWGSLWVEKDYRRRHPFLSLPAARQVEELVRFFQTPLARLAKGGLVRLTPARHEAPAGKGGAARRAEAPSLARAGRAEESTTRAASHAEDERGEERAPATEPAATEHAPASEHEPAAHHAPAPEHESVTHQESTGESHEGAPAVVESGREGREGALAGDRDGGREPRGEG